MECFEFNYLCASFCDDKGIFLLNRGFIDGLGAEGAVFCHDE